ncbi:hypothetical protein COV20_05280 [Candidatus Woesearchaeota archaeon CG10_big_fil_rev_8_21_14_0_10_45_16]|nr:MAG: hypothetical protein COV20_05280 [Candidatus Woesearchaeota archaeon CG10_big_fil_rev_8_21_14_0_10_45_16]
MIDIIILEKSLLVFTLALVFGLTRQWQHKPIGFGTFTFVSLGACALAITALNLNPGEPLPLLGSIVTGIGFLGAGALIKTTDKISGFTSAATIWLFAIFGLLIGVGEFLEGFILYGSLWVVMILDIYLEKRGLGSYQKKITIKTNRIIEKEELDSALGTRKPKLNSLEFNRRDEVLTFSYFVEGTKEELNQIPRKLSKKDWFDSFRIE